MTDFTHPLGGNAGFALNSPQLGEVRVEQARATITTEPSAADRILMMKLAAGHTVCDAILFSTDMDTGAGLVLDVGILDIFQDPADTTDDDVFFPATTIGQGTTVLERMSNKIGFELAPTNYERTITITWDTVAATFAAGEVGLQFWMRAVQNQELPVVTNP
jgi:hypothetical protein